MKELINMLNELKKFADENMERCADGEACVGFEYDDIFITNPFMDECGCYYITAEQSIDLYGEENIREYIKKAKDFTKQINK